MKKLLYFMIFLIVLAGVLYYYATQYWIPNMTAKLLTENQGKSVMLPKSIEQRIKTASEEFDRFLESMPDSAASTAIEEDATQTDTDTTGKSDTPVPVQQLTKVQFYRLIDGFDLTRADELAQLYEETSPENTDALFDVIKEDILQQERVDVEVLRNRFNTSLDMKMIDSLYHYYQDHKNNIRVMLPALRNTGKELVRRKLEGEELDGAEENQP